MRFSTAVAFFLCASFTVQAVQKSDNGPLDKSTQKLRSSIKIAPGKFGKALDARATPALIEGNARFRQPPITVECWTKLNSKKNFNILVASDEKSSSLHWEIYSFAKSGRFSAYLPGKKPAEIQTKIDICDGKWHHAAMQYDGKTVFLYVDGRRVREQSVLPAKGLGPNPGPLTIGMVLFKGNRIGCDGLIDEVRISNGIRSIARVPDKKPILDLNTIGLWHFDSLSGFAADPSWTPRPVTGANVPAWWKETDKDWFDDRLRKMDTGRTFNATFTYPSQTGMQRCYRGTAIRLGDKGEAAVLIDRNQLRMAAGWSGAYLQHNNRRFGLLNTPRPAGDMLFATRAGLGWTVGGSNKGKTPTATTALPATLGKYLGMYRHGRRTVLSYRAGATHILDSPWAEKRDDVLIHTRTLRIGPSERTLRLVASDLERAGERITRVEMVKKCKHARIEITAQNQAQLVLAPRKTTIQLTLALWSGGKSQATKFAGAVGKLRAPADLLKWTEPGAPRWTQRITTRGNLAKDDKSYVIDTLTVPYDNPYKALFFLGGLDFLPNGDLAVCTAHGDVWLVKGVANGLTKLTWKRFATGLYQPMGLKVVNGKIFVLERGQLTRLHDRNNDGEADFYECFNDHWHVAGGEHSYDTCLETDPQGNFYFFNGGDGNTPTGGCLLRVSKDGKKLEVFSTGFRHPIGLSASPGGIITGADQEGNWMPATRIDQYRHGGFYGDMRTHHRKTPPAIYDQPLCWLPREMDNSAGGQIWAPSSKFGPLSGKLLHLSYGRCRLLVLLRQQVDKTWQAGAYDLGLQFLSGVMRGRISPKDGHLYVCGMDGWQTAAIRDGCLQRVRFTGKKAHLPVRLTAHKGGIRLAFSTTLDKSVSENVNRYQIYQWNYRWSGEYGSKRWSVADSKKIGQDAVTIECAELQRDGKTIFLRIKSLRPVMQMQINYNLQAKSGKAVHGTIFNTIHRLATDSN